MKKRSSDITLPQFFFRKSFLKQITYWSSAFLLGAICGASFQQFPLVQGITTQKHSSQQTNTPLGSKTMSTIPKDNSLPTNSFIINRTGYSLAYDPRTRNASWVYENLSGNSLAGRISREGFSFKEDNVIPQLFRSTLKDYQSSGFDRGHLAPAADHGSSSEAMADTFFLSNISPQQPQFNRGYWAKLEKQVRDLTKEYKKVEVYTGPLYLPEEDSQGKRWVKYQVIGVNNVAVPTHFFKVIFLEKASGKKKRLAYILPNAPINASIPLEKLTTTVQAVEKAAGIIFPSYP